MEIDDAPKIAGPIKAKPAVIAAALAAIAAIGMLLLTSRWPLPPNSGFLPAFGAATFCVDLITAILLLAQSSIVDDRARADLGRAYLFSALIIIPHMLSFPGVFGIEPIIGNSSGAVWLWCAWHTGFPLFAIFYLRASGPARDTGPVRISRSVGVTLLVVSLLATLFTVGLPYLPVILIGGSFSRLNTLGIGPVIIGTNVIAAFLAWLRLREDSSLATCVFVALSVSTIDALLTLSGAARFSLGWYASRLLSLSTGIVVLVALVSELLDLLRRTTHTNTQLRLLTGTDSLTGIANRRKFDQTLDLEWRRAVRSGQRVSLLMIDIDQFKAYNDHYGHPAGDTCLRQVAAALAAVPHRPGDLVARIGGEEFAVLLPDTNEIGGVEVAEALNVAVSRLAIEHSQSVCGVVTCSIGVATVRPVSSDGRSSVLVGCADMALYEAKRDGRNRVRLFTADEIGRTTPPLVDVLRGP